MRACLSSAIHTHLLLVVRHPCSYCHPPFYVRLLVVRHSCALACRPLFVCAYLSSTIHVRLLSVIYVRLSSVIYVRLLDVGHPCELIGAHHFPSSQPRQLSRVGNVRVSGLWVHHVTVSINGKPVGRACRISSGAFYPPAEWVTIRRPKGMFSRFCVSTCQ